MIRLRTLGSIELGTGDGEELGSVTAQPRRVALLVWLALARPRGLQRRDLILPLFWPEHDEPRARNALNQAVHFLRRSLGADALVSGGGDEIGLARDRFWCDAEAFEEALDAGRLEEALALYRGELLRGFHLPGSPAFEQWLDQERRTLAARHLAALESMAARCETSGDLAGAVEWWRKAAGQDPYSARIVLRLMRALAAAGDVAAAIRHAQVHEGLMREELGASADRDVAALAEQLRTVPRDHARPRTVPTPVPPRAEPAADPVQQVESKPRARGSSLAIAAAVAAVLLAGAALALPGRADPDPPIRTIAVLPLDNVSGDSTQEYLADAITDALITELARNPELHVISRQSVVRFKRSELTLREIASQLGADAILEGTFMRDGDRIRVTAQLIHAASDRHVWAERFTRDVRDVLSMEAEIAESIAREVRVAAAPRSRRATPASRDTLMLAQYLRAREAFRSRTPGGIAQAILLYKDAIERDSTFAPAHAGLADAYRFYGGLRFGASEPYADSARASARHALALDSTLSEAHASLAALLTDAAQWEDAERHFRLAVHHAPSNALAQHWFAILLATLDRKQEAVETIRRARILDPLSGPLNGALHQIESWAGVPPAERAPAGRGLAVDPAFATARLGAAIRHARAGRCAEADAEMQVANRLSPDDLRVQTAQVGVYWLCGERQRARALLDAVTRRPDANRGTVYIAMVYAGMEAPDSAFAWLDREVRWGMIDRFEVRTSPNLAPLRGDARYPALLRRIGLE